MRNLFLWILLLAGTGSLRAQPAVDSLHRDSLPKPADSLTATVKADTLELVRKPSTDTGWVMSTPGIPSGPQMTTEALRHNRWFQMSAAPRMIRKEVRRYQGKELIFYILVALCLFFAGMRQAFPKYFNDLFRLFFRTTLKQRQIREQLMQTPLPSLMLNGFYVITAGLYIDIILQHFKLGPSVPFWLLFVYAALALSAIYFIKFLGLKLSGWIFNMEEAASAYVFIVFVVNKMVGIFLLPVVICLAFMEEPGYSAALVISWCGVGGLLLYRLVLTFGAVRNQVRVNPFHFFLYLCAFEIAPVLLIYKGLLVFFTQTA